MSVLGQSLQQIGQAVSPAQLAQAFSAFQDIQIKADREKRFNASLEKYDTSMKEMSPAQKAFYKKAEKANPSYRMDYKTFSTHQANASSVADMYSMLQTPELGFSAQELEMYKNQGLANLRVAPQLFQQAIAGKQKQMMAEKVDVTAKQYISLVKNGDASWADAMNAKGMTPVVWGRMMELNEQLDKAQSGGLSQQEQLQISQEAGLTRDLFRNTDFMEKFKGATTLEGRLNLLRETMGTKVDPSRINSYINTAEKTLRDESAAAARSEQTLGEKVEELETAGVLGRGRLEGDSDGSLIPKGLKQDRLRTSDADAIGGTVSFSLTEEDTLVPAINGVNFIPNEETGLLEPEGGKDKLASELGARLRGKESNKGLITSRADANKFRGKMQNALDRVDSILSEVTDKTKVQALKSKLAELHGGLSDKGATGTWGSFVDHMFGVTAPRYTSEFLKSKSPKDFDRDEFIDIGRVQAEIQTLLAEAQLLVAQE